ncbi:MAG: twin-arginine translocation signal domain-containing protein, partial [Alphaproteobacteria bacterium]
MTKITNRRKFIKGSAVAGVAAAGTLAAPHVRADGHGVTLKMQAAWGGGIFLENAKSYVDRVHAMAG